MVPRLILGPLLRYVGETEATVWVETDTACTVDVLGTRATTFAVEGHHYALVHCTGLEPDRLLPYEVHLDGERVWPDAGSPFPPSVVRTPAPGAPTRISFGSCRVSVPNEPPWSLTKDEDPRGREVDALRALSMRMAGTPPDEWPDALVMLGDQVYADEVPPAVRAFIRARRDVSVPPGETVADFEEYCRLYHEAWSDPWIRWLLSTVATAMIFDDHDVHDDWNTSHDWVLGQRAHGWWDRRIVAGFMSYWIYQHLGNLAPADLDADELWPRIKAGEDPEPLLRDFAFRADREVAGTRWSYCRNIGSARLVMIDSRAGRVLTPGGRTMVDEEEWAWIEEHAVGGHDHLLLGTSLPLLASPGVHHLEAWDEAVCDGAWGPVAAGLAEKLRQGLDLEHWAAFNGSFRRFCGLLDDVAAGRRGAAPGSIVALSGDVHHAYLAEVGFPAGSGPHAPVYQAVCSPFRNPLDHRERRAVRFTASRAGKLVARALARAAGVADPPVGWRLVHDAPWFDNQVATLDLDGPHGTVRIERTLAAEGHGAGDLHLEQVFESTLA